jgi:hypothetical protein
VSAAVVGCVFYRFDFEDGVHQTPFHLPAISIPTTEGTYTMNDALLWDMPTNIGPT